MKSKIEGALEIMKEESREKINLIFLFCEFVFSDSLLTDYLGI
ncbi:MAG: hypothetical protein QY310_06315 [Candidatus Jettenia sp. CY-1]|nr:MAG: hypothetical protein QY310_06315 [Candidatus Jettenia sp. CY-1]